MTWQTEFDELVQYDDDGNHLAPFMNYNDELPTNTPEEVVAAQVDKDHGCNHDDGYFCTHRVGVIKAFIQDLLDRKAREIEAEKRYGFIVQIGKMDEDAFVEWNKALDQALSILKEE